MPGADGIEALAAGTVVEQLGGHVAQRVEDGVGAALATGRHPPQVVHARAGRRSPAFMVVPADVDGDDSRSRSPMPGRAFTTGRSRG